MPPPNNPSPAVPPASSLWCDYSSLCELTNIFTANLPLEAAVIAALESKDLLAVDVGSYGTKRLWGRTKYWDGRCVYVVELNDEVVTTTAFLGDAVRQYNDVRHDPQAGRGPV